MRTAAIFIAVLCLAQGCQTAEFKPYDGPKPIAVFIQTNPWSMVIGSDTPRVAIYDDGQVIFAKKVKDRLLYHHVTVDKADLATLSGRLKPVLALKDLKPNYSIRNSTDQPEAIFYLRDGDRVAITSVYGLREAKTALPASTVFPNDPKAVAPPEQLLKLHTWLCSFDLPKSEEWTPKYVEVMLWDYSYALGLSVHWPNEWPSLKSERAIKRGDSYSIYLNGALLPKLREFLATRREKGAVEVDGKKLAVSYRFVFPGEPVWRKALAPKDEEEAGKKGK